MRRGFGLVAVALSLAACDACGTRGGTSASPTPAPEPVPPEYAGKVNPLPTDDATLERGHALFLQNCSPCHGPNADGKGLASEGMTPPPANFRDGVRLSSHADDYLYWRVSEGKRLSSMPSFAGTLSEDERWAILRYLRSLPGAQPKQGDR